MSNLRIGSVSTTSPRLQVQVTPRSDIVLADVTLNIRRLGDPSDYATYDVLQAINNVLIFQFDALLFDMPYGRYAGTLVFNGTPYASFEFNFTADVSISPALQVSTTGPYKRPDEYATPNWSGTGVSGPGTFIGLKDVSHSYAGCAGFVPTINGTETGIEFLPPPSSSGGSGGVVEIVAGTNVTVDNTDPTHPIVSAAGGGGSSGVQSIVAGANVTVNNTDPHNPIISASGGGGSGGVVSVTAGSDISVNNADPTHPIVSVGSTFVRGVVAGTNCTVNSADPAHPIINVTGGGGTLTSVQAGAGITVDNTTPTAPKVARVGGYIGTTSTTAPAYTITRADLGCLVLHSGANESGNAALILPTGEIGFNNGEWVDVMQLNGAVQISSDRAGGPAVQGLNGTTTRGVYDVRRAVYIGNYNWVVI